MKARVVEVALLLFASTLLLSAALALPDGAEGWLNRTAYIFSSVVRLDFDFPVYPALDPDTESVFRIGSLPSLVRRATQWSVAIIGGTVVALLLTSLPLGILSATHRDLRSVRWVTSALTVVSSVPVLIWGTVMWFTWALWWGWVPLRATSDQATIGSGKVVLIATAAVLSVMLGDRLFSDAVQRVRLSTEGVLAEGYMRTVRAADLGFLRHLLQSLVPPVAELMLSRSMFLIGSAIVVEWIFSIPGLGYYLLTELSGGQDLGVILACSLSLVMIGIVLRMMRHYVVLLADPRGRL